MKNTLRMLLVSVALAPAGAFAAPITIDFTVTAIGTTEGQVFIPGSSYAGFPSGTVGSGWVTFDDIYNDPFGLATDEINGLPTLDLEFSFLGITITEETGSLFHVGHNALGEVTSWAIGGAANDYNGVAIVGPTDFWVTGGTDFTGAHDAGSTRLHIEGFQGSMRANVAWTVGPARSVPEPATLGLLGLGLLGVGLARRRYKACSSL